MQLQNESFSPLQMFVLSHSLVVFLITSRKPNNTNTNTNTNSNLFSIYLDKEGERECLQIKTKENAQTANLLDCKETTNLNECFLS